MYCEFNISHPRYQPSGERGIRPSPLASKTSPFLGVNPRLMQYNPYQVLIEGE